MKAKTYFRPCIDLHNGAVKQIVGGTLSDNSSELKTNFVSTHPADYYANLFKADAITGGHVIKLGPGNEEAAKLALSAYPNGLQIGGGITIKNANSYMGLGASHVIVTSWLFDDNAQFNKTRLVQLSDSVGKNKLVIDLSCRRKDQQWIVSMNRWQTPTNLSLNYETLDSLAQYCDEFLIHAADVEGKCGGIDKELVQHLGNWGGIPITYAGGAFSIKDLDLIQELSNGNVDLTIGSALDIYGGSSVKYADCIKYNQHTSKR